MELSFCIYWTLILGIQFSTNANPLRMKTIWLFQLREPFCSYGNLIVVSHYITSISRHITSKSHFTTLHIASVPTLYGDNPSHSLKLIFFFMVVRDQRKKWNSCVQNSFFSSRRPRAQRKNGFLGSKTHFFLHGGSDFIFYFFVGVVGVGVGVGWGFISGPATETYWSQTLDLNHSLASKSLRLVT